jgi:hypothetical protein
MTIKDLLDVIDPNREYNDQYIEISDGQGGVQAKLKSNSDILEEIENRDIEEIEAIEKGVIRVWIRQ